MTMADRYWHEKIVKEILGVGADVLFIVDKQGLSEFPAVKTAIMKKYPEIIRFQNEIKLRIKLKNRDRPIIVQFDSERDIPYNMLSRYAVITLNADILFPMLDRKVIYELPPDDYQAIYELYDDNIHEKSYERLSERKTREFIGKGLKINGGKQRSRIRELRIRIDNLLEREITGHKEWIENSGQIAEAWGEVLYLTDKIDEGKSVEDLTERINDRFVRKIGTDQTGITLL